MLMLVQASCLVFVIGGVFGGVLNMCLLGVS